MSFLSSPGFWTGVAGVIVAVTALVRVFQHNNNPGAHGGSPPPQP